MMDLKKQLGQSLMETIVAMAIMIIVIMAILGLTIASIAGQKENEQQVIANNLAREGIELVRNIRDSNWLNESADWDLGISENAVGIIDYDETVIDYGAANLNQLYISPEGFYVHDDSGRLSPFSRTVTTESICLPSFREEYVAGLGACTSGEVKVGVKVTSIVEWMDQDKIKTVSFEDLLYDWK